jgi:16S rRNA processing protein RimM
MKDFVSIGKILKTHGLKGAVKVFIDPVYMSDFEDVLESVFINDLPYFIREKDINTDDQAIIFLEDIDTKESAQKLCGKEIKVPADQLSQVYEEDHYQAWIGYSVSDQQLGAIGQVAGIIEMPQQVMLQILYNKHQVLIPINDVFILKINKTKKEITTNLPDGFLDIF